MNEASNRTFAPWITALLLVALGGCERGEDRNAYAPPPPPEVIVAHPVEREVVSYLTYTGVVEAAETVELRARVQGFLEQVLFKPGQRVKKGDELFLIDPREYQNRVAAAAAEVQAQEALLVGAENDARLAQELADKHAGPAIDAVIKKAKRDTVAADVLSAKARLEQANLDLEYCRVVAPIDGRITENLVDEGNLVGRGEPTLLATIVNATPAYVHIDVSENDVLEVRRMALEKGLKDPDREPGQISPGVWMPCELRLADETEFQVKGRVDHVEPQVSAETGTLRVRTTFENADEYLVPGLFATVRFPMSTQQKLLVPEEALLRDQQGRFALVVDAENTVESRRVRIGVQEGGLRVIEDGLSAGDRVVVLGVLKARPGAKVNPKVHEPPPGGR